MLKFLVICNNLFQLSIVMVSTFIPMARSLTFNRALLEIVMKDKKQNILIIDDERPSAESLAIGLERNGFLPQVAVSGEEGLKKLQYVKFDFTLCDINMPEMNGWEFASKLPVLGSSTNLIFITAETTTGFRKEYRDIPVLTKPIELEILVSYLKHWDERKLSESLVLDEIEPNRRK